MKLYRYLFIISIALLPLLYGCPENNTVVTKINRDGSCIRTVGDFDPRDFEGIDSVKNDIPIPVDRSWKLENTNDTTAVLMKEFKTVDELNDLYSADESEFNVYNRKVELEKRFRWFHTIFILKETYSGVLTEIPLTNYMSKEEAEIIKMDDSESHPIIKNLESASRESLIESIEERFGYWLDDNIYSIAFDDILSIADSFHFVNKEELDHILLKDTLKNRIDESEKILISFDFEGDQMDMIELTKLIGKEIGLDSMDIINLEEHVKNADLEEKYDNEIFAGFIDSYNNEILMPGLLIDTNAESIAGDTLIWDVGLLSYLDSDYIMYAESKVTNDWAYLVSGFILAIAIIIPFLSRKKA